MRANLIWAKCLLLPIVNHKEWYQNIIRNNQPSILLFKVELKVF